MKASWPLAFALLFFSNCAVAIGAPASHADAFSDEGLFTADVNDLKDTQLVAHPDVPMDPAKNVLWCGTLQLAWNEALDLIGEKPHFKPASPEVDLLNRRDFKRTDLDPGSYVAIADFERNNVEDEIRAALQKTFHGAASPELIPPKPFSPGPTDFVAYAYLFKNLAFETPFFQDTMTFEGKQVQQFEFGGDSDEYKRKEQTRVCDYRSPDDFVIELKTKSTQDQLILAKIAPQATLAQTMEAAVGRLNEDTSDTPGDEDTLAVPMLNFDLQKDFSELVGLTCKLGPKARIKGSLTISEVKQLVRFQLNEKGAVLKSEAVVVMVGSAATPEPHREFIFDKPFLILLKQKSSRQPYFALWVGNPSLLVAAKDAAQN